MELIDFEFRKERKLGEFVQDFINLLKIINRHLVAVLLKLLLIPISVVILLGYYISTQISLNTAYTSVDTVHVFMSFLVLGIGILLIALLAFGLGIEYFILLRNSKSLNFNSSDILRQFKVHMPMYLRFFLAMLVVGVLISIPAALAIMLSALIPFIGSFAMGVIFAMIGLWFFSAFMLYREGYYDLIDCFGSAFTMLKKKILEYGLASYIVSFIFQALLSIITIVPMAIVFLIAYNSLGYHDDFFASGIGRGIATFGGLFVVLLVIIYYLLSVISYGIIYETAKELQFGEDVFERIDKLGRETHA